ncbi:hypothetical protein BaRGS_00023978 [Batillaria attramentaria]|uniref:Uncharacterized protein n=1 Tax=Batillaria attramentaria TaxID=370345 RepID=A0ABD0KCE4_9CAEN|nr:hypothetical protein BaRGS_030286 [Batillaria attramentaria]
MERNTVIVVAVSLHRLYLLRAAVLPLSWYLLPDVRKAFTSLTERVLRRCGCPGGPLGERGEFSVAYSTLQESRDASTAPETAAAATGAERRHNPFNETETV